MSNYKKETELKYKRLRHHIEADLPGFCRTFFMGKETIFSETTATAYAYEFHAFFSYLCENNSFFRNKNIKNITLEDLSMLTTEDIDEYFHYRRYHEIIINDNKKESSEKELIVKESTVKESTISKSRSAISSLYAFFINRRQLTYNPTIAVARPKKEPKKPIVLQPEEQDKLFAAIDYGTGLSNRQQSFLEKTKERDRAIFQVLLDTGIRVSELVGLDVKDINFDKHSFSVRRKRKKEEDDIFFSDYTQTVLLEYLAVRDSFHPAQDEDALFLSSMGNKPGNRISVRSVQYLTKKYMKSCCPEREAVITPHKMRSTYGTEILKATGDLELVSELLGHSSLNTTRIYAQYDDDKRERARNIRYSAGN